MTSIRLSPPPGLIDAVIYVPGSKSVANRALVCALLAKGSSTVSGLPSGDDTAVLVQAMSEAKVLFQASSSLVTINGESSARLSTILDAGMAGTTSRFLTAVAALSDATTIIDGHDALRVRPMADLHNALELLGAVVTPLGEPGCLPVSVSRGSLRGGNVGIKGDVSSQFISALMLIGPVLPDGLHISIEGPLVSRSYVETTARVMTVFGASVSMVEREIIIEPSGYVGCDYSVEPDYSSAAFPLVACALRGGVLTIPGLAKSFAQGDSAIISILRSMGVECIIENADVVVRRDPLLPMKPLKMDMSDCSDLVPIVAVLCASANGVSEISGVGFIRHKESDRLGDLAKELSSCGISIEVLPDGLRIVGSDVVASTVLTHHDHRLAMAFGVLSLVANGLVIEESDVVTKSWPDYFTDMRLILGPVQVGN